MNLATAIDIYAGGPGSGCNPKAGVCGRPSTGKDYSKLSDRAKRALISFKPLDSKKLYRAKANEVRVAKLFGSDGKSYKGNSPFDVLVGKKIGIEVKTIITKDANPKITVHPESRRRKEKYAAQNNLKKVFTVVFDERKGKPVMYVKGGVGAFRLKYMTQVGSMAALKKVIGG